MVTIIVSIILFLKISLAVDSEKCSNGICNNDFKTYDMPSSRDFIFSSDQAITMELVSAGMRRTKVIFVQVDIYVMGLYITNFKQRQVTDSIKEMKGLDLVRETPDGKPYLCIVLKFARSVGHSAFVDAIMKALAGSGEDYQKALLLFKNLLISSFESGVHGGIVTGNEIIFGYAGNEEMIVSVKGVVAGVIKNSELRVKLLETYTGANSVTPEVVTVLSARFSS